MTVRSFAAAAVAVLLVAFAAPAAATVTPERTVLESVNAERAAHGAAPLAVSPTLTAAAASYARRLAAGEVPFRHDLADLVAPGNYPAGSVLVGENLGRSRSLPWILSAFNTSASHHRILVDPAWDTVGVGVAFRDGRIWVVERFADAG